MQSSLENFFTNSNLEHLRELALRELASPDSISSAARPRRSKIAAPADGSPDQIMVCLSSRGPNSARLLRFASRLAGRLNRNWYAVYVQTPSEEPDRYRRRHPAACWPTRSRWPINWGPWSSPFKGQNVADTILRFAHEYRIGQIVIGRPRPVPWWKRLIGHRSVAEELIHRAEGLSIIVVDAESEERRATDFAEPTDAAHVGGSPRRNALAVF